MKHGYPPLLLVLLFIFTGIRVSAQLRSGFDKQEYRELILVSGQTSGIEAYIKRAEKPHHHTMIYRAPVSGLDNRWDLWMRQDSVITISIRGTTAGAESWLANFYAAMVPAEGTLHLSDSSLFSYKLANHKRATVHIGWLVCLGYMAPDMLSKLDSCFTAGIRDVLIMGHSQGGSIAYLLTAYLRHLQAAGKLPEAIRIKTYCSAAPKPGNLYFAYEYEQLTQQGWAYNVVNAADWVPETPISIQTVRDFNTTNPFKHAPELIKKQRFPKNIALRYLYNRLDKPTRKAQRQYEKYLGKMLTRQIQTFLPGYRAPEFEPNNHYVRTGVFRILWPESGYYDKFPEDSEDVFIHHGFDAYLYLLDRSSL